MAILGVGGVYSPPHLENCSARHFLFPSPFPPSGSLPIKRSPITLAFPFPLSKQAAGKPFFLPPSGQAATPQSFLRLQKRVSPPFLFSLGPGPTASKGASFLFLALGAALFLPSKDVKVHFLPHRVAEIVLTSFFPSLSLQVPVRA